MSKDNKKDKKKTTQYILTIALTILLLALIFLASWILYKNKDKKDSNENILAYTELVKEIQNRNVEKIEMTVGSTTLKVTLKNEINSNEENPQNNNDENKDKKEKTVIVPSTQVFMELIQNQTL